MKPKAVAVGWGLPSAYISGSCTCASRHPRLVIEGAYYPKLKNSRHASDCPKSIKRAKRKARRTRKATATVAA